MITICVTIIISILTICATIAYNIYIKNKYNPELFADDVAVDKLIFIESCINNFKDKYFNNEHTYIGTTDDLNILLDNITDSTKI